MNEDDLGRVPALGGERLLMAIIDTGRESERCDATSDVEAAADVTSLVFAQVIVVDSTSRWLGPPGSFLETRSAASTASAPRRSSIRHSTTTFERRASWTVRASSFTSTVCDTMPSISSVSAQDGKEKRGNNGSGLSYVPGSIYLSGDWERLVNLCVVLSESCTSRTSAKSTCEHSIVEMLTPREDDLLYVESRTLEFGYRTELEF